MSQIDLFDTTPKVKNQKLNILPENPETSDENKAVGLGRFPSWLHRKLPKGNELWNTEQVINRNGLHTVCEEARCPNLLECWSKKTATFLVMGKDCTRSCGFCSIDFAKTPKPLEADEPEKVAQSVQELGLKHVVITMVARDDLPDGGADHLFKVVETVRHRCPESTIELLTSDFHGNFDALKRVLESKPEIFNHNIETVREYSPKVRHTAMYDRTLSILRYAKSERKTAHMLVKSGLMVGFGETEEQVQQTLRDLKEAGCDIVTIGQYLQPSRYKLRVKAFVTPEQFKSYEDYGYSIGLKYMYCGPFIRSSYNANLIIKRAYESV